MIFAVAAIALVACSKEFDTNKSASNGTAIGFNTWAEQLTKARTAGASTFGNGDSFKVEGFKTLAGSPVTVFNDVTVSTTNGSTWTYDNTRFWDSNATSYTFFAVSSPNTALTFAADGKIAATAVTFSGENNDILLANSVDVNPPYSSTPVALTFKHIGALVDLKVKKSAALNTANATVAISGVTLEKIDGTGNVAVTGYTSNVPTVAWTDLDGNTSYGITSGVVDCTLPSDFITAWEAGKHYTYILTIDANTINFSASITDWTNVNGYHYLLN